MAPSRASYTALEYLGTRNPVPAGELFRVWPLFTCTPAGGDQMTVTHTDSRKETSTPFKETGTEFQTSSMCRIPTGTWSRQDSKPSVEHKSFPLRPDSCHRHKLALSDISNSSDVCGRVGRRSIIQKCLGRGPFW